MNMSSDTQTVGFSYSVDEQSWQLIRLFRNEYPEKIWFGTSTPSPVGNGTSATFEKMSLTQTSVAYVRLDERAPD